MFLQALGILVHFVCDFSDLFRACLYYFCRNHGYNNPGIISVPAGLPFQSAISGSSCTSQCVRVPETAKLRLSSQKPSLPISLPEFGKLRDFLCRGQPFLILCGQECFPRLFILQF